MRPEHLSMAAQVYPALHPGVYLFSAQLQGGDPTIAATAQVPPVGFWATSWHGT